jgi:hypothetical protein
MKTAPWAIGNYLRGLPMISRRIGTIAFVLIGAIGPVGCGNYSNDDLDFQLALPEQSDIAVKTQLLVLRTDSAEYYLATRNAIKTFNTMVLDLVALIDHVRGNSPTSRQGDRRIWGPFPSDKYPTWEIRVVMDRSTVSSSLLHMDYWVQLRPVGQGDSSWVSFLAGDYTSQGSATTGSGHIHLLANDVRVSGYPIDDDPGLATLDHLDVTYSNVGYPTTVNMTIVNLPTATTQSGTYAYAQNQDGSGRMTFNWQGTDAGVPITATMTSQWVGSGAGRADLTAALTPNLPDPPTLFGTDCWGVDTVATYSKRLQGNTESGSPDSCLF